MTPPRSLRRWLRGVTLAVSAGAPLAGGLLACGSVSPVPVQTAQTTPREAFLTALVEARAARDSAYTCRAPGTSALSTLGAADGAIDEALGVWAQRRAEATQQADKAYAKALDLAPSPEDELVVRAELAELWFSVLDEAEVAVLSATPTAYRFNNDLQTSLRAAAVATFAPVRSRVTRHLDHCVRLAGDDTGPGSYFQRCQDIALRLSAGTVLTPPEALPPAASPKADGPGLATAPRPIQPTVRPRPCTFRGTLAVQGRVYDGEHAEKPSMELSPAEPIEVDTLDIPRTPGGRYRIAIKGPVERQGWLEAPVGALVLRRRVDLVADHAWAPEGLRVQAADARGPTVRIMSVGARGRPQPGVTALDRRIFCYDLALASPLVPAPAAPAAVGKAASFRGAAPVPFFARAGGKQIAKLPPTAEPSVLESSGAFSHVTGSVPFLFDGWVRTPSVGLAAPAGQR